MANGALPRGEPARFTIADPENGDRVFDGALAGEELVAALELVRSTSLREISMGIGPVFATTAFEHVFSGATEIALDSPQGERLLALCKETGPNPLALEAWLADLVPAAGDAPEPTTD